MGKKNLDKLFQEKLKDFSEIPDDKVWQSIETSLDQKKKSRKVIPIWWKLGGVAAILLVAVTLINPFEDNATTPIITDTNNQTKNPSNENNTDGTFEKQTSNEDQIIDTQTEAVAVKEEGVSSDQMADSDATSNQGLNSNGVSKSSKNQGIKNQNVLGVQVANSDPTNVQNTIAQNEAQLSENNFDKNNSDTQVAASDTSKSRLEKNLPNQERGAKDSGLFNELDNSVEGRIGLIDKEDDEESIQEESKKKSIFDEIAEQEQEEVVAENSGGKWSAGPSVAPVYFSAIGEGSPVHSIFVPNSKSGDVNLSYGLSVAYEVNKNYTLTSKNLVVGSKVSNRVEAINQNPFLDTSSDVSAASAAREGTMEQQFGYLEVPLELNYALVNNRFGINLIGGVSSLFLVDNAISLNSGELTTEMGEANNVNSVNFSTNIGFGMNYKFTPKVQLNIEPVFKYQLNTFSETDGTFNPFSVGVYSGLSFKF